ncbi:hypothetical protein MMC28_003669 [Mycoblastus sanguinarius]|nr:hypothetical protein [Mycoblastus sanguinarius]
MPSGSFEQPRITCRFYSLGSCTKGADCAYEHIANPAPSSLPRPTGPRGEIAPNLKPQTQPDTTNEDSSQQHESRTLKGATVEFGPGAEVSSLELPADYSAVPPGLHVTQIQTSNDCEAYLTRLQMSSVICTWYKPSRIAWLHYERVGRALAAERFISGREVQIWRRKIRATCQVPEPGSGRLKGGVISVQLGNLDVATSKEAIERRMPNHLKPLNVVMGRESYSTTAKEAEDAVKGLLSEVGSLEAWEVNRTISATQVKATARFQAAEDARRAVSKVAGTKLPQLANSKIFLSALISVKFNILKEMYNGIQGEIENLKAQIWDASHVHVKAYPTIEPTQKLIVVRLYGENAKSVAKAKSSFEKILAGSSAMNGDAVIWDDFFTTPSGLSYLREVSHTYHGFIYRDSRKQKLSLHGSVQSKERMQSALIEKMRSANEATHHILLNGEQLKNALQGSFRRIVETLGKQRASLDVTRQPKRITIIGSTQDVETAQKILTEDITLDLERLSLKDGTDKPDCAVCWTEAEDPYFTPCGHVYCGSCFAGQCSSAGKGDLPIRCVGDLGDCSRIFNIQDLKLALPSTTYDQLLEDSFTTHIRTHPTSFQYCPTPDCPSIYRLSTTGTVFTCPTCLTPICTTCQITSHDGFTCAEYAAIIADGGKEALEKWKEENDVRDCPACKVAIEKDFGCNHMECANCQAHICWFCMEVFKGEHDCYDHMNDVHGSIYGGEHNDSDDEADD